jgi:hypothetical protein
MYQIKCPECGGERSVRARKPWMTGEEPFLKICKSCCQKGKEKTVEWRSKLSESVKAAQTEDIIKRKSQFMKEHPEIWENNLIFGYSAGWNKGLNMPKLSESTKQKISESMKINNKKKNK